MPSSGVGEITGEVESPDQAIEAFHRAQAIWEPLVVARPDDHELVGHLAQSYLAVGKLRNKVGNLDLDGAMKSLSRARAILEPLAAANPLEPNYQSSLADCYSEIAAIQARRELPGESLILLEKAEAIEKSLINRYPDKHAYQKSLAEITNVLGYAYYRLGKNDEALKSFGEVQNICVTVLKQVRVGPKPLWILNFPSGSPITTSVQSTEYRGSSKTQLKSFEQSLLYRTSLVDSHPSVTDYKAKLGWSCREIAQVQHEAHQDAKAFQLIERSVDVLKALVREQPDQAGYHSELWPELELPRSIVRRCSEKTPRRLSTAFEQAVAEQQLAVDRAKAPYDYRGYLANHLDNLGEQFADLGRVAEGLTLYRRSLQIFRDLSAAHPEKRDYALWVVKSLIRLGTIERHDGDSAAARESFTNARLILERWWGAAPGDAALRVLLGAALDQEANTLFDQGLANEAKQRLERALVLLHDPDRITRRPTRRAATTAGGATNCSTSWGSRRAPVRRALLNANGRKRSRNGTWPVSSALPKVARGSQGRPMASVWTCGRIAGPTSWSTWPSDFWRGPLGLAMARRPFPIGPKPSASLSWNRRPNTSAWPSRGGSTTSAGSGLIPIRRSSSQGRMSNDP